MLLVRPPRDRERLQRTAVDIWRVRRAVEQMDVQEREPERPAGEAREVGAAVEAGERRRGARKLDVAELARRNREPADLPEPRDLARVVEERLSLLVP